MLVIAISLLLVLLLSNVWTLNRYLDYRSKVKQRGFIKNWPIQLVPVDKWDTLFATTELGPSLSTQVIFIGSLNVSGGTSDMEAWIISVLSKNASNIFEFGTCTGKTTYLMAANSKEESKITTLTLSPEQIDNYDRGINDDEQSIKDALSESVFTKFVYSSTPEEKKITQLYGDSKSFDETPYKRKMDLIFIDGSHAYSYVQSDTKKAFEMLGPNGIILWHDYRGPRQTKDVFKALNELSKSRKLVHIKDTCLVAFKNE